MARSGTSVTMAFTRGLVRSTWSRHAAIVSSADNSCVRMRRANSAASRKQISAPLTYPRSPDDGGTYPAVGYCALWLRKMELGTLNNSFDALSHFQVHTSNFTIRRAAA